MQTTKDVRGQCQQCGGQFDFPAEHAGLTASCPHCGQPTELLLATPPEEESPIRRKAIVFTVVAIVILLGGLTGVIVALKRAERMVAKQPVAAPANAAPAKSANSFATQEFRVSPVTIERTPGSKLVYAQGSVFNLAKQQRFGVKVELQLLDGEDQPVANASDYTGVIEPDAEWRFRALVVEAKAVSAKIVAIKESK
jgi:hypothetical protein